MMKKIFFFLALIFSVSAAEITAPMVVLGGGIAGMTAALQVSQAGVTPLIITGPMPGGMITLSPGVENWPGDFLIAGSTLADKLEEQLSKRAVQQVAGTVTAVDFSKRPFTLQVQTAKEMITIKTGCCIIAIGATPNLLKIPGEQELLYKKIFTCAPCDGLRFKNQKVAVIGGGEGALVEAHYLANIAQEVILIVRGNELKTTQTTLKEKTLGKPNVKVLYNTTVQSLKEHPEGIELQFSKETLRVQGVFLAIGSNPNTSIFQNQLELDADGFIVVRKGPFTSIPGIFAAGDVSDRTYRQAITAAGDATKAALEALYYVSNHTSPLISSSTAKITEISDLQNLKQLLHASDKPIVAYFYSPSCGPCRSFRSFYQKWATDFSPQALFLKINGESCPACFVAYNVQAVPTVLILNSEGQVLERAVGSGQMLQILKFLDQQKKKSM